MRNFSESALCKWFCLYLIHRLDMNSKVTVPQFLEVRKTNGEPYMLDNLKESFKGGISVLHFIIVVGVILGLLSGSFISTCVCGFFATVIHISETHDGEEED